MVVFDALTYAAVQGYGDIAWHEGLLYHFSRRPPAQLRHALVLDLPCPSAR
jgi:hypothetical protein